MRQGIISNNVIIARFVAPTTIRSNKPVFVSDSLSLRRYSNSTGAQRWEIESALEPLTTGAQTLMVDLVTKHVNQSVAVVVPQNYGAYLANIKSGAYLADGNQASLVTATGASAGDSTITLSGIVGTLSTGTFIKFVNHGKLYMLTKTGPSGSFTIYPELRVSVPNGTIIDYSNNVQINFQYDIDTVFGMSFSDGILMDPGTVKLVERI